MQKKKQKKKKITYCILDIANMTFFNYNINSRN